MAMVASPCASCCAVELSEEIPGLQYLAKAPAKAKSPKEKSNGKLSALDAAAKVLGEAKEPMNTKAMIEAMAAKGYWTSPGGKTPHATLYSAILREIDTKGSDSRFKKTERGMFGALVKTVQG